jgi:hypothetical protein
VCRAARYGPAEEVAAIYHVEFDARVLFDEEHGRSAICRLGQRAEEALHHDGREFEGQLVGEHDPPGLAASWLEFVLFSPAGVFDLWDEDPGRGLCYRGGSACRESTWRRS